MIPQGASEPILANFLRVKRFNDRKFRGIHHHYTNLWFVYTLPKFDNAVEVVFVSLA